MPQRIVFPSRGEVRLVNVELPGPGPGEIRVRCLYSLVSIGTETTILHQRYAADSHFARMFSFPQLKTGVQAVARVEAVGGETGEFRPGDLVYLRQAHGSHQVLAASDCSPIPEGIDLKQACWAGLAKTAFRAIWAGPVVLGDEVVIVGAGPVGQMAVRWCRVAGAAEIIVADLSAIRLEHASRGGATQVLQGDLADHADAIGAMGQGQGPALIIDSTGNAAVFQHALSYAAPFGKVILLGDTGFPGRQCLTSDVMTKGLTVQAVHDSHDRDGWTQRRVDQTFFDLVLKGSFDLSGLITHEFKPHDCEQAYALAEERRAEVMGLLFDWTGMCD